MSISLPAFSGFTNPLQAAAAFERMMTASQTSRSALEIILPHLVNRLLACADPDRALVSFERFAQAFSPPALFPALAKSPRTLEILITLFAGSQFLTDILLRSPENIVMLHRRDRLAHRKTSDQIYRTACAESAALVHPLNLSTIADALRRFQRRELLRIGACDMLDLYDLPTVTAQLSALADGLSRAALETASAAQTPVEGFVVLALGKLGGGELNYSSDIDLLFIARENPQEYSRLGETFIDLVSRITPEGFLYRVDMRLRPWGTQGPLVSSVEGYLKYLSSHARLWEKQALLKTRPIAGDLALGRNFLSRVETHLYASDPETVRASVHAMKQRTEQVLRQQGRSWGEVKLGEGSIRDVEFIVQFLQMAWGGAHPQIRSAATLEALPRLQTAGLLTSSETRTLSDGYIFLRTIEHYLQMMHYRQTNALPADPDAIGFLARRLGFDGPQAGDRFLARYQQHGASIRAIYLRHVGKELMTPHASLSPAQDQQRAHIARLDPAYLLTFSEAEIQQHTALVNLLDLDRPALVDVQPLEANRSRVTIVAYDYPGELTLICGLMFVYGWNIHDGEVFTYEPGEGEDRPRMAAPATAGIAPSRVVPSRKNPPSGGDPTPKGDSPRKIVDVFTVSPVRAQPAGVWEAYTQDLTALLKRMAAGQRREARGELARRVAAAFQEISETESPLFPVDIEIDNNASERYTLLRIEAPDTVGFLYEFTNALAMNRVYIARVIVQSVGSRVNDVLYVTDEQGRKITAPEKQRELRAATVLIKHFTHLLPRAPNAEIALLHFREFLGQLFQRPHWPDELVSLERSGRTRTELEWMLQAALQPAREDWREVVNAFKDREMFRMDMRHLLGHAPDFWSFAAELTDLAEVVMAAVLDRCTAELTAAYGNPRLEDGSSCALSLMALGKCGGRELGFASDIELMFLYSGKGQTDGEKSIPTGEFFEKLVSSFVGSIHARQEGIFQVDLQLRPYGKAGALAVSLDAFKRYFAPGGPAWAYERQALVKLRWIAGDEALGMQVERLRDAFVYSGEAFDVTSMRAMRERQVRHLVTGGTFNAKYSPGGLVDVEYLVQGLQITHGPQQPALRSSNIRDAMAALNEAGILQDEDYPRLRKAHTFLRWLIDSLRVVRGNAKDVTVPGYGTDEFAFLARRLLYHANQEGLRADLERYATDVIELNRRLLGD
jgi:glutamate-ammonia-ligase adenylyltransferase